MTKHTPGPWIYHATAGDHDFSVYPESDGRDVALVRDFNEANARLIATVQRQFRRLIIQACLGYEYGCCYVTKAHAEVYDSANHAKEYE